jgi:uncharacterized protein YjdB
MRKVIISLACMVSVTFLMVSCRKEITTIGPSDLLISKTKLSINVGSKDTIQVTISPSNAMNKTVLWSSSDTTIAIVNTSGVVTALAPGIATITVTTADKNLKAYCTVTVTIPITGISLPYSMLLNVGDKDTLKVTLTPSHATAPIIWSSIDTTIARVNTSGVVTGVSPGITTILATTADKQIGASCEVTVISHVISVALPQSFLLNVGDTDSLQAIINPSNAIDKSVTWSSSNNTVLTINASGVLTGIEPGTDTIKVTTEDGNRTATCIVTVTKWTVYTTSNGLADNYVSSVAIDSHGNKWFGTEGGVSEFDGMNWTTYNTSNSGLMNNWVYCIAIDASGNKWFGTMGGGVSKFDGINWITYMTTNSGLIENHVNTIAIDAQGNKWFGTPYGVSKFDDINWTTYDQSNTSMYSSAVNVIVIDAQDNKWFGTSQGVSEFDGINWTNYNYNNSSLSYFPVYSIGIDNQGNKWFGTAGGGVSRFDGAAWISYNRDNSELYDNGVQSIAIDAEENKWFGTTGASKFDGSKWITYNNNAGFTNNYILSIAIDKQGNKWFGTANGVFQLQDNGDNEP